MRKDFRRTGQKLKGFTQSLTPKQFNRIKKEAEKKEMSVSEFVRFYVIPQWLEKQSGQVKLDV